MTIRPLTAAEAIPPTLEAPAEVAAMAWAYVAAQAVARAAAVTCPGTFDDREASLRAEACWRSLEDLLCRLAVTEGRAWYRVGETEWGLKQGKRGSGFELARRSIPSSTKGPGQ